MINDNRSLPEWPERKILYTFDVFKNLPDEEPNQQVVVLSCGHWCMNTYGLNHKAKEFGGMLRCRTCGMVAQND